MNNIGVKNINIFKFDEIQIGSVYEFEKIISKEMVMDFADISGDFNPLHVDEDFGIISQFGKNVVHGMLLSSFFSALVGMYCPGRDSLYLSQSLNFCQPVFFGEKIIVRGTVKDKNESVQIIVLKTEIIKNNQVVVFGEAKVKLLK